MRLDDLAEIPILPEPGKYVIPDGIEPAIGFKYLDLLDDGRLRSPSYGSGDFWPEWAPYEARCESFAEEWQMEMLAIKDAPAHDFELASDRALGMGSASVTWTAPSVEAPPGMAWFATPKYHQAPQVYCRCGIYAVGKAEDASSYHKQGRVLCEVALWGNVIPGTEGCRAQYAYVKKIYPHPYQLDAAARAASRYGLDVIVRPSMAPLPTTSNFAKSSAGSFLPSSYYYPNPFAGQSHRNKNVAAGLAVVSGQLAAMGIAFAPMPLAARFLLGAMVAFVGILIAIYLCEPDD